MTCEKKCKRNCPFSSPENGQFFYSFYFFAKSKYKPLIAFYFLVGLFLLILQLCLNKKRIWLKLSYYRLKNNNTNKIYISVVSLFLAFLFICIFCVYLSKNNNNESEIIYEILNSIFHSSILLELYKIEGSREIKKIIYN